MGLLNMTPLYFPTVLGGEGEGGGGQVDLEISKILKQFCPSYPWCSFTRGQSKTTLEVG